MIGIIHTFPPHPPARPSVHLLPPFLLCIPSSCIHSLHSDIHISNNLFGATRFYVLHACGRHRILILEMRVVIQSFRKFLSHVVLSQNKIKHWDPSNVSMVSPHSFNIFFMSGYSDGQRTLSISSSGFPSRWGQFFIFVGRGRTYNEPSRGWWNRKITYPLGFIFFNALLIPLLLYTGGNDQC